MNCTYQMINHYYIFYKGDIWRWWRWHTFIGTLGKKTGAAWTEDSAKAGAKTVPGIGGEGKLCKDWTREEVWSRETTTASGIWHRSWSFE